MIIMGSTDYEIGAYWRTLGLIHARYGVTRSARRRPYRRRVPKTIDEVPFDPAMADAIISLVCYHGAVPVASLLTPRAAHWTRDLRAAAAWLLRDRFHLTPAAISFRLATTPTAARQLLTRADTLRRDDRLFADLLEQVQRDLTADAKADPDAEAGA